MRRAQNPHRLMPDEYTLKQLWRIAHQAYDEMWHGRRELGQAGYFSVKLPDKTERYVPVKLTSEPASTCAYYDIAAKNITVNMPRVDSALDLYFFLVHEAIHAIEFLSNEPLARWYKKSSEMGAEKISSLKPREQHWEYYMRQHEANAYMLMFAYAVVWLLDKLPDSQKAAATLLKSIAAKPRPHMGRFDRFERALIKLFNLARTAEADEVSRIIQFQIAGDWFGKYTAAGSSFSNSFANILWYAIQEWLGRGRKR